MNHTEFIRADELKSGDVFKINAAGRVYSKVLEIYSDSTDVTVVTTTWKKIRIHYTHKVIVKTPRNITS